MLLVLTHAPSTWDKIEDFASIYCILHRGHNHTYLLCVDKFCHKILTLILSGPNHTV